MLKKTDRYFYPVLSVLLIVFETICICKGEWSGDFWEHSAVVNELARHLIHPQHPMLDLPAAHAFFSPYSLMVAIFSRVTGLGPILSLQCFAFFNLLLFIGSFYFFCRSLFKTNYRLTAGLSLLFILFFWGSSPFLWSGFYHIFVLKYVLPYPSTFAISLSFIVLGILANNKPGVNFKTAVIVLLTVIVFLSHPYTGAFLLIAVSAMVLTFYNTSFKEIVISLCIVLGPALLLCVTWPYYSFIQLMTGSNVGFHDISKGLYDRPLGTYWPAFLALPAFFLIKRNKAIYFLFLAMALMFLFFVAGYIFGSYGVSRIMSTLMIFAQMVMAYALVTLVYENFKSIGKLYVALVLALFTISIIKNLPGLSKALNVSRAVDLNYYKRYDFLKDIVPANALVLSDPMSNWYIPSYSGKVIASVHPLFLVDDNEEREEDVTGFFNAQTHDSTRQKIILKYNPVYVLIDLKPGGFSASTLEWLNNSGAKIYDKDSLRLIRLTHHIPGNFKKQK